VVTHLKRQYLRRDPDLEKQLRLAWTFLPDDLRRNSNNLSVIRFGTMAFVLLIVLYLVEIVANSTPQAFLGNLFSFNVLFAFIGLACAIAILLGRCMQMAPHFINAYVALLPAQEDEIRGMYDERGAGDVIAPWIRGKPGRMAKLGRYLAKRFSIMP